MFKNKEGILLITSVVLVFVLFVAVIIISFQLEKKSTQGLRASLPKGVSNPGNINIEDKQTIEEINKSYDVGQLINILPYSGKDFSLSYSFSTNSFTLYLKSGNEGSGNQEFDAFLKKNGIINRSWFNNFNLYTTSLTITPAP